MKHYALGWACNLSDVFVRFPYEKCKSLIKHYKVKSQQKAKVKRVFRVGVKKIIEDIIENNNSFQLPKLGYYVGEIHFEPVRDQEFRRQRELGKFKGIDFLETLFTGYQLYLYISGKRDNFLARRKFPVYISKFLKEKMETLANSGKTYG